MEKGKKQPPQKSKLWLSFILKTLFYTVVLLALIYFYHFNQVDNNHFIYNEF